MKVEIWSDVMCPWCYIGKKRFEKALDTFDGKDRVEVEWKSFQLNPTLRTDPTKKVSAYLAESKGWSPEQVIEAHNRVTGLAKEEGLDYQLDKAVLANSMNAHRLMHFAREFGKSREVTELLFRAYFTEGLNTDDHEILIKLAEKADLPSTDVKVMLESDRYRQEVIQEQAEAQQLGCNGVPFFVIDRKYGVSGAQMSEVFLGVLERVESGD